MRPGVSLIMQATRRPKCHFRNVRGSILISVLVFVAVISLILVGAMTLTVSYSGRVHTEADYVASLDVAEAGVNYEIRKISQDATKADQAGSTTPPGVSYLFGNGAFRVYCANRDGSTPWTPNNPLYIYSTGTVNGTARTVRVATKYVNNIVTWNLASAQGDLSAPQTFVGNGSTPYNIVARGYQATSPAPSSGTWVTGAVSPIHLYGKVEAGNPSETGLGTTIDPGEHEIAVADHSFVQLDMTNLSANNLSNIGITVGSIQKGEGYCLWGSNTSGTPGTLLMTYTNTTGNPGADMVTFTVPSFPQYTFFSVSGLGDNVLVDSNLTAQIASTSYYSYDNEWRELNGL